MRHLLPLALALALSGCGGSKTDDGPSCDKVVDNMLAITKAPAGHEGMSMGGDRKAMLAQCESRKMPAEQRKCLATAKDVTQMANCSGAKASDHK